MLFFSHADMHTVVRKSSVPLLHNLATPAAVTAAADTHRDHTPPSGAHELADTGVPGPPSHLPSPGVLLFYCNVDRAILHGAYARRCVCVCLCVCVQPSADVCVAACARRRHSCPILCQT